MSYPAELLDQDLGSLIGQQQRPRSGFAALGELLGGGIDRQGAYLKGQVQSAKTQEAIERARLVRNQAGIAGTELDALTRIATERPDLRDQNYNPLDIVLGGRGADYSAAQQGRIRAQEFDNRAVLGNPLADALTRQAAGDAVQGDFKAFEPVGSDAYYEPAHIAAGVQPVPAPPDSLAARKRTPVGYRYVDDGSLEYIPGGPADPATQRPAPKGYRYDQSGQLVYVPGGPADPINKVDGFRPNADRSGVEPIPGAPTKVPPVSEGERKSATLATRLENARRRIEALELVTPGVSKPGLGERAAGKIGGEIAANYMRSPERRQVDAAQVDALDAALTLATGAAYTEVQLEGQRKAYFPQPGDDDATAQSKREAFDVLVALAYEAAGRAAPSIDKALKGQAAKGKPAAGASPRAPNVPRTNAQGWELQQDDQGNLGYVSPDGKQVEEVQ